MLISGTVLAFGFDGKYELNNRNASTETKDLFEFLKKNYKNGIISGQQTSGAGKELAYIYETTGKLPAIAGFDMINQTIGWNDNAVDEAIAWHNVNGGIVSFVWHWFTPYGSNGEGRGSFYSNETKFNVLNAVTEGTKEYEYIVRDIRLIADQLKKLEENDVPVLWRPLHEAGGTWFWWSSMGPDVYRELWNIMYDILQNEYQLTNLIWVWSANTGFIIDSDWYVGDDKCDIVSVDIYFKKDGVIKDYTYDTGSEIYYSMQNNYKGSRKIIALSETDQIPDVDKIIKEEATWAWFMPWYGGFITENTYNQKEHLYNVYNNEKVITLDDLPRREDKQETITDLTKYVLEKNKEFSEKEGIK